MSHSARIRRLLALSSRAPILLAATLFFAACGDPSGQFFVVQNQLPTTGCVIPSGKSALYRGEGILDVRVPAASDAAYLLFPLLQNDLPTEGAAGGQPNRIALAGFEVDLRLVDGPQAVHDIFAALANDPATVALLRYQSPWSGSLDPGGGTAAASTSAFPAETARRLRDSDALRDGSFARVNVLVRAVGNKMGSRIKSDVFTYPIRVCDGCLINSVTSCPATGLVLKGGICNPGQDAPVDCCTRGTELVCPATGAP